jgi:hypothetical protein
MRHAIAAAFALAAASSLGAQTPASNPDLTTATPVNGNWAYAATPDGSEATFSNASGYPQLWLRCTRVTRRVSVARPASAAAPLLNFWTSSMTRGVPSSFNPATGRLTAELGADDPLLDALATSRGRIGFSIGNQPALVVPSWPEAARVIEDCRG